MSNDAYRQMLVEAHRQSSEAYDKAVMTLAGGALAISITFVHNVAPHPKDKGWLAWSWGLLALSLLLIFASFLASQRTILREIAKRDGTPVSRRDISGTVTTTLNLLSGAAFIAGVACLVTFALFNI